MNLTLDKMQEALSDLKQIRFKSEIVNDRLFTICSYMIADPEIWKTEIGLEARGITFDENGICVSRPFEKFFNLNEREETQQHIIQEEMGRGFYVTNKVDGSMITPVLVNGKIFFKTKKSFFSDVAIKAQQSATQDIFNFCIFCQENNLTPIFEFTHPEHRIVIKNEVGFTLLAIRENTTGEYQSITETLYSYNRGKSIQGMSLVPVVEFPNLLDILVVAKIFEDIEGWVIVLADRRVKIKTDWYIRNHKLFTDIRERDVADMVIEETLDDIKSTIEDDSLMEKVCEIEGKVLDDFDDIEIAVMNMVGKVESLPDKEAWLLMQKVNFEYPGAVMQYRKHRQYDARKIWIKYYRNNYSLTSIGAFNGN